VNEGQVRNEAKLIGIRAISRRVYFYFQTEKLNFYQPRNIKCTFSKDNDHENTNNSYVKENFKFLKQKDSFKFRAYGDMGIPFKDETTANLDMLSKGDSNLDNDLGDKGYDFNRESGTLSGDHTNLSDLGENGNRFMTKIRQITEKPYMVYIHNFRSMKVIMSIWN
jgi:hypothetical protein